MKNPIKIDDLGVFPYFWKHPTVSFREGNIPNLFQSPFPPLQPGLPSSHIWALRLQWPVKGTRYEAIPSGVKHQKAFKD